MKRTNRAWQHAAAGLDYGWRVLATGFNFLFFFTGGLLLAVTALPLARLLPGSEARKCERARHVLQWVLRYFVWQMEATGCIRVEIRGAEHLQGGGRLVIANHPTLIDVLLLLALLPRASCVVKAELWRNASLRHVIRATGYISNADPTLLLQQCRDSLAAGQSIVIFPEGTRSRPGQPLRFQRGAAQIAVRCGADIAPVLIRCTPPLLRKGEPWYRIPPRRAQIVVEALPAWPLRQLVDTDLPPSLATRQLNRQLEARFQTLLQEAPTGRVDGAHEPGVPGHNTESPALPGAKPRAVQNV